jgi:hypothetical protein
MAENEINWQKHFPRPLDNLLLLDYPTKGKKSFVRVDNIEFAVYEYQTSAAVTSSSTYSNNLVNTLIPMDGHLYLTIPTVFPYDAVYAVASPAAGVAVCPQNGDSNTRYTNAAWNGTNIALSIRESLRVQLKMPAQVVWWGLDQMSDSGDLDWLTSPVDNPNPAYMFPVTDLNKNGTVQMQFTMPTQNLTAVIGLYGRLRFYTAFIEYCLISEADTKGKYTIIATQPPSQGSASNLAPLAQRTPVRA